jgi:hypothetical protein
MAGILLPPSIVRRLHSEFRNKEPQLMDVQFAHTQMAEMRAAHPDWIWNRSDTHAFVAVPGTHESFKSPVEPGNSFSPGAGTYGVSTWVAVDGVLHAPEEKPLADLPWRWEGGSLPVLVSEWSAGDLRVVSRLFAAGDASLSDIKNYLRVEITNRGGTRQAGAFYLALRSFGAAGGPLHSLARKDDTILVNGKPLVYAGDPSGRFGAVAYADSSNRRQDISVLLKQGVLPDATAIQDDAGWASGALAYDFNLAPGQTRSFDFVFHVQAQHWMLTWLQPPAQVDYAEAERSFLDEVRQRSPVVLDVPDHRFADAFGATLNQLYSFTVGDAARISPLTYPLWWIRDCAYIVTALDRGGLHDFAGRACADAVRVDAMTGFGGEADVPGELIWMLSEHYLLQRDEAFLRSVWPFIRRKADLLVRARSTDRPIRMPYEFVTHEWALLPVIDLFCAPAQRGLITGRMDHHFPLFWVNAFAYIGLRRAAMAAGLMGEDGGLYAREADALQEALHALVDDPRLGFGKNERDVVAAIWPCQWPSATDESILRVFNRWWAETRCPRGVYAPERLWTYFPVGEAHNYLLLKERERTWQALEWYFDNQSAPGTYGWSEGEHDENSALLLWQKTRGWDRMRCVTPTGWTLSEMFLLLRDCLAYEDGDRLVLGLGVPSIWMDKPFGVQALPTHFGALSYHYDPTQRTLRVQVERPPRGGVELAFPEPVTLSSTEPIGV